MKPRRRVDLRTAMTALRDAHRADPTAIYLFGSRAQETGSKRSDVDLLIHASMPISIQSLAEWRQSNPNWLPLDLFLTRDLIHAESAVNGSGISCQTGTLVDLLGAQLLWTPSGDFTERVDLVIEVDGRTTYAGTMLPEPAFVTSDLPSIRLGSDWMQVAISIAHVVESAVAAGGQLGSKAKNLTPTACRPADEYDFQNLAYLVLKAWFADAQREPVVSRIATAKKSADIALSRGAVIIEAKYVKDSNSAAAVAKQLAGLDDFYRDNPSVRALVFLIAVEAGAPWDSALIDERYTHFTKGIATVVRSIGLPKE